MNVCSRCGQTWPIGAGRPDCAVVAGRRCTPGAPVPSPLEALADLEEASGPADSASGELDSFPTELPELPGTAAGTADSDRGWVTEPEELAEELPGELDTSDTAGDTADTDEDEDDEPARRPHRGFTKGTVMPPHRDYDWPAAKKRYVEGIKGPETIEWPTLDDVADHFGYPRNRTREKSAAQGWRAERTAWQAQVEATRRQARAAGLAKQGLDIETKALDAAKTGLQLCNALLVDIGQRAQRARADGSALPVDALEQTRLAQAVDLWHKVGMRALGDPDQRIEVTGPGGQRLEIAQELQRDNPDRISGVLAVLQSAGLGDLFGSSAGDAAAARATLEARRGEDGTFTTDGSGS